jgi:hypothetical protein
LSSTRSRDNGRITKPLYDRVPKPMGYVEDDNIHARVSLPLKEEFLNALGPKDVRLEGLFEELFPPIEDHLVVFVNNDG